MRPKVYTLFLIFFISFFFNLKLFGQSLDSNVTDFFTCESLPFAYGWFRPEVNDKWQVKENEIRNVDQFKKYYLVSYSVDGNIYVALVKESKEKGGVRVRSYVVDFSTYQSQLSFLGEYALVEVPLLKFADVLLPKNYVFSIENLDLNPESSQSALSKRGSLFFHYKVNSDSTVKFLFYSEFIDSEGDSTFDLNFSPKYEYLHNKLGLESVFSSFFYKTTNDYFFKFINSPLNY